MVIACPNAMSGKRTGLPVSEGLGVFVSVIGVEWLFQGYADPIPASILAVLTAVLIMLYRHWQQRRLGD